MNLISDLQSIIIYTIIFVNIHHNFEPIFNQMKNYLNKCLKTIGFKKYNDKKSKILIIMVLHLFVVKRQKVYIVNSNCW